MRRLLISSLLIAFLLLFIGAYYVIKNVKVKVELPESAELLSKDEVVDLKITTNWEVPVGSLEVYISQNGKDIKLYKGPIKTIEKKLEVRPLEVGFKDGPAKVITKLHLPLRDEIIFEKQILVDLTPPQIEIIRKPQRLIIGEPGVIEIKVSEPVSEIFIKLDNAKFPLLPVGNNTYKTVITAPLFLLKNPSQYYVEAYDLAGNSAERFLPILIRLKKFKEKKIVLSKEKLQQIVLKYFSKPENLVEQFKVINEKFRKEDESKLMELSQKSENHLYAEGRFLQLPGSKPTAWYGDHRYYYFEGKLISESIHKGLDLAKYRHAPVVAANNGRVIFVGKLKIYGKVVLIDHGFGVVTLYGHLNDYKVKPGDVIKKGQVIGHTDTTGLALGDHLHFGTLVWGYAANPIFFFDGHYLKYYFYRFFK
jgi:murein DD-endopeptidase MepM/ murein hydrolase activator NlpD